MSTRSRPVVLLSHAATEVSWLFASIQFCAIALVGRAIPFVYSLLLFVAATVVGRLSFNRGLRNVLLVAIQVVSFAAVLTITIHAMNYRTSSLLSTKWVLACFDSGHTQRYWVELVLAGLAALLYWVAGLTLARRPLVYRSMCTRFDIGLASFFAVFLIRMVMEIKGGNPVVDNSGLYSLFSFLLFGLFAIGAAKVKPSMSRSYLSGYGVIGVVATLTAGTVFCVGCVVLFFLPAMEEAAKTVYSVLAAGGGLLGSVILPIVRFLFGPRNIRPDPPSPSHAVDNYRHTAPTSWYGKLIEDVMMWGAEGLMALLFLFAAGVIVFFVGRWLLRRSSRTAVHQIKSGEKSLMLRLWLGLRLLFRDIFHRLKGYRNANDLFSALKTWARRSGLAARGNETPSEFGKRLVGSHPRLKAQIDVIVDAFNRETYGDLTISKGEIALARSDLRFLSHPRHWPRRLRTLLVRREGPP